MAWNIKYENDTYPTLQVLGDRSEAERIAVKRNKYGEAYTITAAPKKDRTIEKEEAESEAIKYGCTLPRL